ncbi:MAG: PAS domain-containing protein [Rhodospirillaceae bacterium]|nr:PAS domain-containing protein [Rhodospirillaceae bacterium]
MTIFRTDHCRSFLAHWQSLRVGNALPTLKDYLGKPHPVLQPNVAIKDVVEPGYLRVRLFGTHLVDVFGADVTGRNLMVFAGNEVMAAELWFHQHMVATYPVGLRSVKLAATASGRPISFEDVGLPLTPFPGGPPCMVCCLGFVEVIDYKDSMFRLLKHTSTRWIDIGAGVPARGAPAKHRPVGLLRAAEA